MGLIALPQRFLTQPQYAAPIDRSGVGAKARFALLGNQGYELVNGIARAGTIGSNTVTPEGIAYVLPSAGTTWAKRVDALDPYVSGSFSVFWRGVVRADTLQTLLSYGTLAGWEFKSDGWAPGQIRFRLAGLFSGSGPTVGPVGVTDGTIHSVGVVYDDPAASVEFFLDGASIGSAGWTKDTAAATSLTFSVKGDATSPHKMLTAQAFSGKLSQAEMRSLHDSKGLSIFKAPARRLWLVSASGITLVGANSTEANNSATGAISQTHILVGANSTEANSASTGAVTQTHILTGANSAQANAAGIGAVTQAHVLAGSNSTQANSASTGAISQGGVFVGQNCSQANAASSGSIAQTHVLTVSNSAQANTASTGAISQGAANNLTAANAAQANSSGTGAITQAHVLVHAPSVQDNIAAASAIVQAHVLAVSNGSQANASAGASIIIGSAEIVSMVEKTAVFRTTVSHTAKFQRSKSVTVRLN